MYTTKEKIINYSLDLFSKKGFTSVSIRDICKKVKIKASTLYYYFLNKQALFDEIIHNFVMNKDDILHSNICLPINVLNNPKETIKNNIITFYKCYFSDEKSNKVIRLLQIEQFNDPKIKNLYIDIMFQTPLSIISTIIRNYTEIDDSIKIDINKISNEIYSNTFLMVQKWLFTGELTDENIFVFLRYLDKVINVALSDIK